MSRIARRSITVDQAWRLCEKLFGKHDPARCFGCNPDAPTKLKMNPHGFAWGACTEHCNRCLTLRDELHAARQRGFRQRGRIEESLEDWESQE